MIARTKRPIAIGSSRHRSVVLASALTIAAAGCIVGPKQDDPATADPNKVAHDAGTEDGALGIVPDSASALDAGVETSGTDTPGSATGCGGDAASDAASDSLKDTPSGEVAPCIAPDAAGDDSRPTDGATDGVVGG